MAAKAKVSKSFLVGDDRNPVKWCRLAYLDYVAARTLLRSGLPLQGAQLASTCIEKYFKALLCLRNQAPVGHLNAKLLRTLKNQMKDLYLSFNETFLNLLCRVYCLRYMEGLRTGFTLQVEARKFLAELDLTVSLIEARLIFKTPKGKMVLSNYKAAVEAKEDAIFADNYLLLNTERKDFVEQQSPVYAILISRTHGLVEATYLAVKLTDDGDFLKPGLKQTDPNQQNTPKA